MDKIVVGSVFVFGLMAFIGLLVGFPIMFLWNHLCPDLFHLPPITFWQALGLYFLIHCLLPTTKK